MIKKSITQPTGYASIPPAQQKACTHEDCFTTILSNIIAPAFLSTNTSPASAETVMTLRESSLKMQALVDGYKPEYLQLINEHPDSRIALYQSNDGVRAVAGEYNAQATIAEKEDISSAQQEFIAQRGNIVARIALAGNPCLTKSLQSQMAWSIWPWHNEVRAALAGNPSLTSQTLQQILFWSRETYILMALASNPRLTKDLQQKLAGCGDLDARRRLARNPNLTDAVIKMLAVNRDPFTRKALAGNPSLTYEAAQLRLAQDQWIEVRAALAKNPNVTPEAKKLISHNLSETQHIPL